MSTLEEKPALVRHRAGRILVLADRSPVGRCARRWAARQARNSRTDILALPTRTTLPTTIPAQRDDLLVLGMHAERGNLPEQAITVIENAPCPTLVFRSVASRPRRVTAAVTGERSDAAVIATAAELADANGSPLHLVHGRPVPLHHSDTPSEQEQGTHVLSEAHQVARKLAPELQISTELVREHGHDAVSRRADDEMVVVGAGDTPTTGLGLVSRAALHHSRSPVVIVKPRGKEQP